MDQIELIALVGATTAVLIFLFAFISRRRRGPKGEAHTYYMAGLNFLLAGEKEKALDKLRSTVRIDTDYIDAYVKIGDILREMGSAEKALKIHRDLALRPVLPEEQRISVMKALAQDYYAMKQWQQALSACDNILGTDRHNQWALDMKLSLYEEMGDWHAAYDIVRKNNRLNKEEKKSRLAVYKVEQGRQAVAAKKEHDGRLCFREAIKENNKCAPAYLELADSYVREERPKDALEALDDFIKQIPQDADLAFPRLKHVLYELGQFSLMEQIYLELEKDHPEVVAGLLGLAEIYEKKGELQRAVNTCNQALAIDANRLDAKLILMRLQSKLGREEMASVLATEISNAFIAAQNRFSCQNCHYSADTYFSRCPSCKAWNAARRG
jgi:lipopolysaccharide biosynthesis regulator YciM